MGSIHAAVLVSWRVAHWCQQHDLSRAKADKPTRLVPRRLAQAIGPPGRGLRAAALSRLLTKLGQGQIHKLSCRPDLRPFACACMPWKLSSKLFHSPTCTRLHASYLEGWPRQSGLLGGASEPQP